MRLLVDADQHATVGCRRKLVEAQPADDGQESAPVSGRLQWVDLHRHSAASIEHAALRKPQVPVDAIVGYGERQADLGPVRLHCSPEHVVIVTQSRQSCHCREGISSDGPAVWDSIATSIEAITSAYGIQRPGDNGCKAECVRSEPGREDSGGALVISS